MVGSVLALDFADPRRDPADLLARARHAVGRLCEILAADLHLGLRQAHAENLGVLGPCRGESDPTRRAEQNIDDSVTQSDGIATKKGEALQASLEGGGAGENETDNMIAMGPNSGFGKGKGTGSGKGGASSTTTPGNAAATAGLGNYLAFAGAAAALAGL